MSKISLSPNASGSGTFTIAAPATNTDRTLTLPDNSGTVQTQLDQGFGFRNRIINGEMRIDQRNNGASVSVNGDNIFGVDRWISTEIGNGAFSVQRVTDAPAGFTNSFRVTVTTAQTGTLNAVTRQSIEGFNVADLGWGTAAAQPVTLSFWAKSSLTGTFGGAIINSASNRSYPFAYSITAANTWEYKTVSIAGDTTGTWETGNGTGLVLWFSHGTGLTGTAGAWAGSDLRGVTGQVNLITTLNATWQITGVQLEAGSVATPFERRPYSTELQLAQRYYEIAQGAGWSRGGDGLIMAGLPFKVTKRAAPTVIYSQISGNGSGSVVALFSPTIHTAGTYNNGAFLSGDGLFQGLASSEL